MIPVCEPTIIGNEKEYLNRCIDSGWISSNGEFINLFETEFAKYCDVKYGATCSSGTAALHLALKALNIKKGDEVIVPEFTMISTAAAVKYVGATPIFVDCDTTFNIDPGRIRSVITERTKAIIVVHTFGVPCNMNIINNIAKEFNLIVIEDAAEAHGATYDGRRVGSLGDIACFSFYGNKIITCGEGGMVVSNNKYLIDRVNYFKNQAFGETRFIHNDIGYNYRMTNMQAAIGLAQLEKIEELIEKRKKVLSYYEKNLSDKVKFQYHPSGSIVWMCVILVNNKDEVMKYLSDNGIQTRSLFYPMSLQPCLDISFVPESKAYNLFLKGLYLPSSGNLTEEQLHFIVEKVNEVVK